MRISVAMCTYNGENYLNEQINTILSQTVPVDEIIICDDGSTDNTIQIINDLDNPIIKVYKNPLNLGSTKNFEQAIRMCSGDIILLADQDDMWVSNKVETIIETFNNNPHALMVFSDAYLINENSNPLEYSLWEYIDFDYKNYNSQFLCQRNVVTGATVALKKEALKLIFPFSRSFVHDEWVALILTLLDRTAVINQKLIYYRLHKKQQLGLGKRPKKASNFVQFRLKLLGVSLRHSISTLPKLKQVQAHLMLLPIKEPYLNLTDFIEHLEIRAKLPKNRINRWKAIDKEMYRYLKYENRILAIREWFNL